jgi:hypothetical protein
MNSRLLAICEGSHRAIRRRWAELLQLEPGWRDFESNAQFTDMMERVLEQLWSAMRASVAARAQGRPDSIVLPRRIAGRCNLELNLPFLGSGRRALCEVLAAIDAEGARISQEQGNRLRWELVHAYEASAERAIEQTCARCRIEADRVSCGRG